MERTARQDQLGEATAIVRNTLLDRIGDGCYALDAEWRFTYANHRAAELLGRSPTDLIGRLWREVFTAAAELGIDSHYRAAFAGGGTRAFDHHYPPHGRWYSVRTHALPDGLLVFFDDWLAAPFEDRRYRALVEHALEGITLVDEEFKPLYRSPANEKILGYPHRLQNGVAPRLRLHPDDEVRVSRSVRSLAPGDTVTLEYRIEHADGGWRWLRGVFTNRLDDPAIRAYVINFSDATEARRAQSRELLRQKQLEETNQRLRVSVDRLNRLHRVHVAAGNQGRASDAVAAILGSVVEGSDDAIGVFLEADGELEAVAFAGLPHPERAERVARASRSLARRALRDGRVFTCQADGLERLDGRLARIRREGFTGVQAVPFARNGARGAMLVLGRSALPTDPEWLSFTETVSGYVAAAVSTARLLERLERSASDYQALARFGQRIETMDEVDDLVEHGLRGLMEQVRLEYAAFAEVEGDTAVPKWQYGDAGGGTAGLLRPFPLDRGALGRAVRAAEPVVATDCGPCCDTPGDPSSPGFTALLVLPIREQGVVKRVIILGTRREGATIDDTTVSIAALFAQRIENALERVGHLDEIRATREATFRSLGHALEYRDYETKGHTDRVVDLARRFGRALGFTREQQQALQWGAYLHDLGKLSVPDQILLKPGRLTPAEFAIIKRHPETGAEMCRRIPFLPEATHAVVRHHHERWDGNGYPDGLAGEEIPLVARLFALVDVYDALTSERPYKRAWSHERAVAELARGAGSQFDPHLLGVFLRLFEDG